MSEPMNEGGNWEFDPPEGAVVIPVPPEPAGPILPLDPSVGPCPPWCELEPGHDWEDLWRNGLVRQHRRRRTFSQECSAGCVHEWAIEIEETEQATATGIVRERRVVLDVEAPTQMNLDTARTALGILQDLIEVASVDCPTGTVD